MEVTRSLPAGKVGCAYKVSPVTLKVGLTKDRSCSSQPHPEAQARCGPALGLPFKGRFSIFPVVIPLPMG